NKARCEDEKEVSAFSELFCQDVLSRQKSSLFLEVYRNETKTGKHLYHPHGRADGRCLAGISARL
ncbi:MAG TPA: hypothetical protein PLF42_08610, partial [Anaerolineales bacterium]|nr:hypothetical protein [Anaerolineales bacterium]